MFPGRIINKIPGEIPAESKKEKQGYIGDLSQKTIPQLNELLERQQKLLANKSFINKLADKGEKIRKFKESIEEELSKKNESERLSKMMSALTMNGKEDLDTLEWTGQHAPLRDTDVDHASDEDSDPLKILASHSGAGFHKKKHKVQKPEEPLIRPSDLMEDEGGGGDRSELEVEVEEFARQLCDKLDCVGAAGGKAKFLPHRTLRTERKTERKDGVGRGRWEVTAATPPLPVHGDAKLVSLQESIVLQAKQQRKLQEVQMKHAAERLAASAVFTVGAVPHVVGGYRDREPHSSGSDSDDDSEHEQEVHDEEQPDGGGVVFYNLIDDTHS